MGRIRSIHGQKKKKVLKQEKRAKRRKESAAALAQQRIKEKERNEIMKGKIKQLLFENSKLRKLNSTKKYTSYKCHYFGTNNQKKKFKSSKMAINDNIKTMPDTLNAEEFMFLQDTMYKGVFGSIKLYFYKKHNVIVAKKELISQSTTLDVLCEAKIMNMFSEHPLFPHCFGILGKAIIIENLGRFSDNGDFIVQTIQSMMGKQVLSKHQWVLVVRQVLRGIMSMHDFGVLHNDIKTDNVILHGYNCQTVKIIDFGKATLKSTPVFYNLDEKDIAKYNQDHRFLAHELRNNPNTPQSEMTDTYSVGYMLKYIGIKQNFHFLAETGRKMKHISIQSRMNLGVALNIVNNFIIKFRFL